MRTTMVVVEKEVERARLGFWNIAPSAIVPFGMVPFLKSREDIEVLLRQPGLLAQGQPLEISGFSVHRTLRAAVGLEEELAREAGATTYGDVSNEHPIVVSYPADLIWLAHPDHVEYFLNGFKETLPLSELAPTPVLADRVAAGIRERIQPESHTFWRLLTARHPGTQVTYARFLIEYAITTARRARAKAFAGIVPCIDPRTPGSAGLSHRFNMAFAHVVDDRINDGLATPPYLYTTSINSNLVDADAWPPLLDRVVSDARKGLESNLFDGVHVTVRGLSRISTSAGRTNVVLRLVERLGEVAKDSALPLWWSRAGIIGLAGADLGCSFTSCRLNLGLDDVYTLGGNVAPVHRFGKVLNPIQRQLWDYNQVRRSLSGPDGGMPDLGIARTAPDGAQLEHDRDYRIRFSKPYNVAAFRYLWEDWRRHVNDGDTQPGREYLQTFEAPYNQWGLR